MKLIIAAILALTVAQTNAQSKKVAPAKTTHAKQNDNINKLISAIPMKTDGPRYDTTVLLSNDMSRDKLEENATTYFEKVFGSGFVNKNGKYKMTGLGKYSFSTNSFADADEIYNVNYVMDISVKDGRYNVTLHNFFIEHQAADVNIPLKLAAAKRNDAQAKLLMACFQQNNTMELKKVYTTMASKPAQSLATVSR